MRKKKRERERAGEIIAHVRFSSTLKSFVENYTRRTNVFIVKEHTFDIVINSVNVNDYDDKLKIIRYHPIKLIQYGHLRKKSIYIYIRI